MNSSLTRRNFLTLGATGAAAGVLGLAGHAQQPAVPPPTSATRSRSGAEYINQATQAAIDRGLEFLVRSQHGEGSFSERLTGATVGITSLAGLALMASGSQPGRGKYGRQVVKAVDYVASMANGPRPGFLATSDGQSSPRLASQPSPMYSHGFGTLFLSEVCGMLPASVRDTKIRTALEQAVAFTIDAQNQEGGWRYEPKAQFADVSVTVAQMMALRAAKNAGLLVSKKEIGRAHV